MQLCSWIAGSLLLLLQSSLQLVAEAERVTIASRLQNAGERPNAKSVGSDFKVYWNVPTNSCRKHHIEFPQVSQRFGIVQNSADNFVGDKIAILYDPGNFPALLESKNDTILVRNGGVPQEGKLDLHLQLFREQLEKLLPDPSFSGLAVIDMESWRPLFRQNWASLEIYRNYSLELERQRHRRWTPAKIKKEAIRRFESAASNFMRDSLRLAIQLRPKARWGYYAYPYCFNRQTISCSAEVKRENDQMRWLFNETSVLYPSVYMQHKSSAAQRLGTVRGRVEEARRLADNLPNRPKVFVYYWFKYQDERDTYVDKDEIISTVTEIVQRGANGLVIWGSSNDFSNKKKCEDFTNYLENSLGPALQQVREQMSRTGTEK